MRTRGAAFAWLVLRLEPLFTQGLPLQSQQPLFRAVLEQLVCLDEVWTRHLGDEAPLLLPIRRQLAQRLELAVQDHAPAAGMSGVIAQVRHATSQLLKPEAVVDNEKDANKLLRTLQEQARSLCAWWLRQNATDLRALRLNRTLNWLVLSGYPDADSERITALRGPAPDKLKRYKERFAQGHYADLILELETSLAGAMFWFDGLHMLWQCLEALQAEQAMTELEVTFALLLQRLPDLPSFCFHDGVSFADAASRDWITQQVSRRLQIPEPAAVMIDAEAEPWEIALQAVAPRLRKDGLKAAIHELKKACTPLAASARDFIGGLPRRGCVYKPASTSWRRSSSNIWTTNCNTQVLNVGSRNWPFR